MQWMQRQGLPTATPLAVWEQRSFGWLTRAILLTEAWQGQAVANLLTVLPAAAAEQLAAAVGMAVARLHQLGFRDRNLDARNLLARRTPDGAWMVAKIDSPRHFLRSPGPPADRAAAADWQRLLPQFPEPKHREVALMAAGVPERQRSRLLATAQQRAGTRRGGAAP